MIQVGNAVHGKVKGPHNERSEVAAARQTLPTILRKTQESFIYRLLRFPRWMYRGYTRFSAGDLAASIAYHALIALVPMFLLIVGVTGLFLRNATVMQQAVRAINKLFPTDTDAFSAFQAAVDARNNSGLISLLSLVGFAWAGTGLVSSMARGMNRVYGVRNSSYVAEKQRGFIVILLFLVFFFLATLTSILPTFLLVRNLPEVLDRLLLTSRFNQFTAYGIAFITSFLLFLLIYRIVPNARQKLLDVLPGSVIASLLFLLMTQIFPFYIELVGGVNRYGRLLGLISLIVAALYFLAHTILFGSYVNMTWQRSRERKVQQERIMRRRAEELERDRMAKRGNEKREDRR